MLQALVSAFEYLPLELWLLSKRHPCFASARISSVSFRSSKQLPNSDFQLTCKSVEISKTQKIFYFKH